MLKSITKISALINAAWIVRKSKIIQYRAAPRKISTRKFSSAVSLSKVGEGRGAAIFRGRRPSRRGFLRAQRLAVYENSSYFRKIARKSLNLLKKNIQKFRSTLGYTSEHCLERIKKWPIFAYPLHFCLSARFYPKIDSSADFAANKKL